MQENISLSIYQLTKLLQNSEQPSKQSSLNTLAPLEIHQPRRNLPKIVSFVDIDEFQETSSSSVFQNSKNPSFIERIHELEEENKELKQTLILYQVKHQILDKQMADYQIKSARLYHQNEELQARLKAIDEQSTNTDKETKKAPSFQKSRISADINQMKCQKKLPFELHLQVRKFQGPSGLKNSSPHRMFSEKKTDRTIN